VEAPLREKLNNDLKAALKSGDTVKRNVIRLVISAINNAEMAKQTKLTDGDILGVIQKEIRQRQESIDAFKQGNRPDLVASEQAEMVVLQSYMPQQATRDELIAAAQRIIAETGARGPADKGKVMPKLIAEFKGKADGREINAIVSELLK
jgi:uncharacterized protein YqeY